MNTKDALKACSDKFIFRAHDEYDLNIHHVEVTDRDKSAMGVETSSGKTKIVPVLGVFFKDETYQRIADKRGKIPDDISDSLRKLWQEITIPYGQDINRKKYCDSKMLVFGRSYEGACFYDLFSKRKGEIVTRIKELTGVTPRNFYPAHEGVSVVFETNDYDKLDIERLQKEVYALACDYTKEEFHETMEPRYYVRIYHPGMKDYNSYGLWLG